MYVFNRIELALMCYKKNKCFLEKSKFTKYIAPLHVINFI